MVRDERVAPSSREPTGVSDGARAPVEPGPLSASCAPRRPMWRGSGRRQSPDTSLVAQSPNPHVWRLSMSSDTLHHVIRWNVEKLRWNHGKVPSLGSETGRFYPMLGSIELSAA